MAPSKRDAGAVSPHLLNYPVGEKIFTRDSDEWKYEVVPPEGLAIVLQLKAGFTIRGQVKEYAIGQMPLAGVEVTANNDLYSESRTGRGGEAFWQSTTTDRNGNFEFNYVYPAPAYLKLTNANWLKTWVGDQWIDDAKDILAPSPDQLVSTIEIMASVEPQFLYQGRVSDSAGKPIPHAKVTFGISSHSSVQTFDDDHSYLNTLTQTDGSYKMSLPTPWIRGMSVEAKGYERADQWKDDDGSYKPGSYDFILKSTP